MLIDDKEMTAPFSQSERIFGQDKSKEYCASIVRIGRLVPIEGSNCFAKTRVDGETIVVNKDQVKSGDIMIYAKNETQINRNFLSINNLYDFSNRWLNSNSDEVTKLIRKINNDYMRTISINNPSQPSTTMNKSNAPLSDDEIAKHIEIKKRTGSFDKTSHLKMICVEGVFSYGYLFTKEQFVNWKSELKDVDLSSYIHKSTMGEDIPYEFDTVLGELFIKAYIPSVNEEKPHSAAYRAQENLKRYRSILPGQFFFNYDTQMFAANAYRFRPNDVATISVKVHGTSAIFANILTKRDKQLNIFQKSYNAMENIFIFFLNRKFISTYKHKGYIKDTDGVLWTKDDKKVSYGGMTKEEDDYRKVEDKELKSINAKIEKHKDKKFKNYQIVYDNIYSSRTLIKNEIIGNRSSKGFYEMDIWSQYGAMLKDFIPQGMTVYGEILGYLTSSRSMIQEGYDYGCKEGENKFMPYRITTDTPNGEKKEWEVMEVRKWTEELMENHPEIAKHIMPIEILYHGRLQDLYPELDIHNNWTENLLDSMQTDSIRFGLESNEPLCFNEVPREGICIRIDCDRIKENFKLKSSKFLFEEGQQIDKIKKYYSL